MLWFIMSCIAVVIISFNIMYHFGFMIWLMTTVVCWLFVAALKLVMNRGD